MRLLSLLAIVFCLLTANATFAKGSNNEPTSKNTTLEETPSSNSSSKRFIFLKTVKKDCIAGDTEIISSIVQVDLNNFGQEKFKILARFEKEISKKFPKNVIKINLNCIEGIYTDLRSATTAKKACVDKGNQSSSIILR